jgi:hypothetical protein
MIPSLIFFLIIAGYLLYYNGNLVQITNEVDGLSFRQQCFWSATEADSIVNTVLFEFPEFVFRLPFIGGASSLACIESTLNSAVSEAGFIGERVEHQTIPSVRVGTSL